MPDNEVRISIVLGNCSLEVSGSEVFVREQAQWFSTLVSSRPDSKSFPAAEVPQLSEPGFNVTNSPAQANVVPVGNPFPKVFDLDSGKVHLLLRKAPGGKSRQSQMHGLALLYLLAKDLQGIGSADWLEIRDLCVIHACLDAPNFSKVFAHSTAFIVSGKDSSRTVRLSVLGKGEAEALATQLNDQTPDVT